MLRRPAPWLALALLLAVPDSRAATAAATVRPELAALQRSLEDVPRLTEDRIATLLRGLARPGMQLPEASVKAFATEFVAALGGRPITDPIGVNWLAGNLDQIVNPAPGLESQVSSAISDFGSGLVRVKADVGFIPGLLENLRAMVPGFLEPRVPVGPPRAFQFDPSRAPTFDRSAPIEDFEFEGPVTRRWYQPGWSKGAVGVTQTDHRASGQRGATFSHQAPAGEATGFGRVFDAPVSLEGLNAVRFWIHPESDGDLTRGSQGNLTIGFIDGTDEIWQMSLPGLLSERGPRVVQVRLADFHQVLRRNNGVIDRESGTFALWMSGTYRYSIDDIRFVHDPQVPAFEPDLTSGR